MANRALSTSQRAGCCAKVDAMPTDIQTVTRANASELVRALRDSTLTPPSADLARGDLSHTDGVADHVGGAALALVRWASSMILSASSTLRRAACRAVT